MSRDIRDRLTMFLCHDLREEEGWECDEDNPFHPDTGENLLGFKRIALNIDQVRKYNPPPNPAKITDSRAKGYISLHGQQSWELDALSPSVLATLIRRSIRALRDDNRWDAAVDQEDEHRSNLKLAAENWTGVTKFLNKKKTR